MNKQEIELKEWNEDLECWESRPSLSKRKSFIMQLQVDGNIFIGTKGNAATYDPEVTDEIWHKLGQLRAAQKRKSKTG